ncbi:hypothetical protein FACS189492_2190 [Clostridia bacterium]|nr:hypothetical protein FACS189492_2190 [Clostridia bacterium]
MSFSEKVKELRKQKGLSQQKLAEMLGVSLRTVQNYELGVCYPKQTNLYAAMARLFAVDVADLLTDDEAFIAEAHALGGVRGRNAAERLISDASALFAGGDVTDDDKDGVMKALQEAYWLAKAKNKKYIPKKYLKS